MKIAILTIIPLLLVSTGFATDRMVPSEYETIQDAINKCNDGDVVIVAPGTYTGPGNRDIDFGGRAITVRSVDPNDPDIVAATIIDCNGTEDESHRGFYFHNAEDANSVLAGFTITNGYVFGDSPEYKGGAILCYQSSPTITNCIITGNSASESGGGIYCYKSSARVTNCVISGNSARYNGGGICCSQSIATITNCKIVNNTAGHGGGTWCASYIMGDGELTISNCIIAYNFARTGGGIRCGCVLAIISDCTIKGNTAQAKWGSGGWRGGGGIFVPIRDGYSLTILNCNITGNAAKGEWGRGGGICALSSARVSEWHSESELNIKNCKITGNSATDYGGAIFFSASSSYPNFDVLNSLNMTNCTISENSAANGGGICSYLHNYGTATITNSILWDNWPEQMVELDDTASVTYSNIQDGRLGEGNIDADPLFIDPGYWDANGTPDDSNDDFWVDGDYHLSADSACIDAGKNTWPDPLPLRDVAGNYRQIDGDEDGVVTVDMGAYEYGTVETPLISAQPPKLTFVAPVGGASPSPQTLSTWNIGPATLNWQVVDDCSWLDVWPDSGTSAGEIDEVTITVNIDGLPAGHHNCDLVVSDDAAGNSPIAVSVTLILYSDGKLYVPQDLPTIQAAIDAVNDGDTVIVADGIYTGPGNRDIDFKGKAITVRSKSGPANCIIDCNDYEITRHHGFYFHNYEEANSILDGFSITNVKHRWGHAIACYESSPTITNCMIVNNRSWWYTIACYESSPTITNCVIADNGSWSHTIVCRESSPTFTNCMIVNNRSVGIFFSGGAPTITHCTISNNGAGGIRILSGAGVKLANCTITDNTSYKFSGAGIYCYRADLVINDSLIARNSAEGSGGGICMGHGTLTVANCTVTENSAGSGGGVYLWNSNHTPTITNSILWGNDAPDGPEIRLTGQTHFYTTISVSYNDVQGGEHAVSVGPGCTLNWGDGNIDADPCFVDPHNGDYHLLPESPCVDAGNDVAVYTDIEGNIRPFDFPGVDNNGELPDFDMGAYELVPLEAEMKLTPRTLNCSSKGNWLKAHFVLPEGFSQQDVNADEPAIAEPMGIESEYVKVLGNNNGPVRVEVAFDRQAFCEAVTDDGSIEVTVIGSFTTGRYFYATDTIRIIARR